MSRWVDRVLIGYSMFLILFTGWLVYLAANGDSRRWANAVFLAVVAGVLLAVYVYRRREKIEGQR